MNMGKMIAKVRYYEWRDRQTPNENGELDHYAEEDADRRKALNITDEDDREWAALRQRDIDFMSHGV